MAEYYVVTDLGALPGGASSNAYDINDNGQVVGSSQVTGGNSHAFLWRPTTHLQDLGTLPGAAAAKHPESVSAASLQASRIWQAAAVRTMRLFGAVWVECKISARCPATTEARQVQSMLVVRWSEILRSVRGAICMRSSGPKRGEWLVSGCYRVSRTLGRTISKPRAGGRLLRLGR